MSKHTFSWDARVKSTVKVTTLHARSKLIGEQVTVAGAREVQKASANALSSFRPTAKIELLMVEDWHDKAVIFKIAWVLSRE